MIAQYHDVLVAEIGKGPGDIAAWRAVRGSHISVVTMGANLTTVDSRTEAIRRWRDVYNSVS